jgi:5'-deoxynucleotidase YfbR-like HD superfamily hydrolase
MARTSPPRAWQRMLSGRRLNLLDPSPFDIEIEDIAHGLARVARWNGQTSGEHAFSVAQHSVLVQDIVLRIQPESPPATALLALLHDGPEYVIGDMISPFKAMIGPDYRKVEERLQEAIHTRFGLVARPAPAIARLIKQADRYAAFLEAIELAGFSKDEADTLFHTPPKDVSLVYNLEPLDTKAAQALYLERFFHWSQNRHQQAG